MFTPAPAKTKRYSLQPVVLRWGIAAALVIGFGLLAFSLVLAHRVHETVGSDDVDEVGRER